MLWYDVKEKKDRFCCLQLGYFSGKMYMHVRAHIVDYVHVPGLAGIFLCAAS